MRGRGLGMVDGASAADRAKKLQRLKTACTVLTTVDLLKDLGIAIAGGIIAATSGSADKDDVAASAMKGVNAALGYDASSESPNKALTPAEKLKAASAVMGVSQVVTTRMCDAWKEGRLDEVNDYLNNQAPSTTPVERAVSGSNVPLIVGGIAASVLIGALAFKAFSK